MFLRKPSLTPETILKALSAIDDEEIQRDVVTAGYISHVSIKDGHARFVITVPAADAVRKAPLQAKCEAAVRRLAGVTQVTAVLTADSDGTQATRPARAAGWNREPVTHVKRVIMVASGKGGVGKSTTAVNLARAAARLGKRVGLLDADVYGPSLPRMMGISEKPTMEENQLIPLMADGIACLSIGLMMDPAAALVWRGPQATRALQQLLRDTRWGTADAPLDILFIDMPPGTGDVQLSLAQQAPIDAAVIVTTPQEVALIDVRKSIDMLRKVQIPIAGIIENMSGFFDPQGNFYPIFGEGGGKRLGEELGIPLLGSIPIDMELRESCDAGKAYTDPKGAYKAIINQLA